MTARACRTASQGWKAQSPMKRATSSSSIFFDKVTPHNAAPTFFAGGGYVITPVGPFGGGFGESLAIGAAGKIVVGGWAINGILGNDLLNFTAVRYQADGHLDTTFGNGGIVISTKGTSNSVALQADGKTILGGDHHQVFGLKQYNVDGTLDTGFGSGGTVKTQVGSSFATIASVVVDGGKIIAVGDAHTGPLNDDDFVVARYLTGALDPTFGNGGIVTTDFGTPVDNFEGATSVKVQPDGKIVVTGSSSTFSEAFFSMARYNPDGTLEFKFWHGRQGHDFNPGMSSIRLISSSRPTAKFWSSDPPTTAAIKVGAGPVHVIRRARYQFWR